MTFEERSHYLQELKQEAGLDLTDPKQKLLSELTDAVSLLAHHVALLGEVTEGLNESMDAITSQLEMLEEGFDEGEIEDYFEGSEMPLYSVVCPNCGDEFAVDEVSLQKGFDCPTCKEHLIQG